MIVINMPGGAIQNIGDSEWLWFRKAFASEWDGATMIRLTDDRIYSIESVADLTKKFTAAGLAVAAFSAPDARLKLVVSTKRVRQVTESNPAIYHEKARSVLVFSSKTRLAVRETPQDAAQMLKDASVSA
jgi:hypothetical protein